MLFQNTTEGDADEVDEVPNITSKPSITGRKKVLEHILPCQTLSKATNMGKRGEIAEEFCTGKFNDEVLENTKTNFLIWSATRSNFLKPMDTPHVVPSFTSTVCLPILWMLLPDFHLHPLFLILQLSMIPFLLVCSTFKMC